MVVRNINVSNESNSNLELLLEHANLLLSLMTRSRRCSHLYNFIIEYSITNFMPCNFLEHINCSDLFIFNVKFYFNMTAVSLLVVRTARGTTDYFQSISHVRCDQQFTWSNLKFRENFHLMHFRDDSTLLLILLSVSIAFSKSFSVSNKLVKTWISTISIEFPVVILILLDYKSLDPLDSRWLSLDIKLH